MLAGMIPCMKLVEDVYNGPLCALSRMACNLEETSRVFWTVAPAAAAMIGGAKSVLKLMRKERRVCTVLWFPILLLLESENIKRGRHVTLR